MKKTLLLSLLVLVGIISLSCARETAVDVEQPSSRRTVQFRVSSRPMAQDVVTKGVPYGQEGHLTEFPFGVAAYTYPASLSSSPSLYLQPSKVEYDPDKKAWLAERSVPWPDQGGTVRFVAYAPYDVARMTAPEDALPVLSYTTPAEIGDQRGLLVAAPDPVPDFPSGEFSGTVDIRFHHVLTGVIFAIGEGISIESIAVSGVYDAGVYHFDTGEWTDFSCVRSYTMDHPSVRKVEGLDVLEDKYILLFPPQTCPEGASIHLEADGQSLDIPIAGDEWPQGYVVPYILGRSDYDYHFETDEPVELDWDGDDSGDIDIDSWREDEDGNVQPVPWIVEGYYASREDAEAKTGKLTDCFVSAQIVSEPDATGKSAVRFTYTPAQPRSSESSLEEAINEALAAASPVGTATSYWNLANPVDGGDFIAESANTYVVSAPGYYRIPLVMGGGVKDGATVPAAYSADNFKDYQGESIQSPYLQLSSEAAGIPSAAYVLWTDRSMVDVSNETSWKVAPMEGAASSISYYGGSYWLHFHIPADKIGQGLVHLSVTDGEDLVMWSYLLWVTVPEEESAPAALAARNLGWVEKGMARESIYDAATAFVRLEQQKIGGKVLIVQVNRPAHTEVSLEHAGYSPYYQFGRKDPLMPGTETGEVSLRGQHATFNPVSEAAKSSVRTSIREPWSHLSYVGGSYDWCADEGKDNWWAGESAAKTVYDPSPAACRIPSHEELVSDEAALATLLPCGRRNSLEGRLVNVGKYAYYWSTTAVDESSVLIYTDDPEMTSGLGRRSRGLSVRPIKN